LVIAISLVLPTASVQATGIVAGDLEVEWEPERLKLRSGEEAIVRFSIRNTGDDTLWIGLMHVGIECPGGSSAVIDPPYFELHAGAEKEVKVLVESHASYNQDDCTSDARIDILWGQNLTELSGGRFDRDTAEGKSSVKIRVEDDFAHIDYIIVGTLVAVVAILVAIAFFSRRRRSVGHPTEVDL
jgi:uncharacterized membrane protein